MESIQREAYIVVAATFFAYSLGKVFDNTIVLATNQPSPIIGIKLFSMFSLVALIVLFKLLKNKH